MNAEQSLASGGTSGRYCSELLQLKTKALGVFLTASCTQALEFASLLTGINPGDEVIMPSFTYPATANAFAVRGAKIVFVDIEQETLNIDIESVQQAINSRTRAIVPVHYAGNACKMRDLSEIASHHQLWLIEDAAHGIDASFDQKQLGTLGHVGAISFHESKNIHCGEGGVLLVNDSALLERAYVLQQNGTDRHSFLHGLIPAYKWQQLGSQFTLGELNASFLSVQLEHMEMVSSNRRASWHYYKEMLAPLEQLERLRLPGVTPNAVHNAHIFYIICNSVMECTNLQSFLAKNGIQALPHYQPLHSAPAGLIWGTFAGEDKHTTAMARRILRLPLYYGLKIEDISYVADQIRLFYGFHTT